MIPIQYALRRRMMIAGGGGAPISDLPLGTLINIGTDGGVGTSNYEIADKDNLVNGGVVLVRKNIYSYSAFASTGHYYQDSILDNLITNTIYNKMLQQLRDIMMDVTFSLYGDRDITRKLFTLTYTMVGFGKNNGVAEGKALQLYTSDASRIKTFNSQEQYWWLSSWYYGDNVYIVGMDGSEDFNSSDSVNSQLGVVPAFVIPSDTPYNTRPNTDGSYNLIL